MKSILLTIFAALSLLAAPPVRAWTYADGDVLLIFRNGSQDVEFDIGSVSQFLGKTNGYTATVTGWDAGLLTSTFGTLNGNVKVVLVASAGGTNWLSGAEPNTTAYSVSSQAADILHGAINAVGTRPLSPITIPTAGTNSYSIDISGQYAASSYDLVVTDGHSSGVSKLGGKAPFTVEQGIPAVLDFWTVRSTTIYPNPPPDTLVGTFTLDASGVLTFVAGPRPPSITGITSDGTTSTVQFTTTVGTVYSLAYANSLGAPVATWPVDTNSVVGNGKVNNINHIATGAAEFYRLKVQ